MVQPPAKSVVVGRQIATTRLLEARSLTELVTSNDMSILNRVTIAKLIALQFHISVIKYDLTLRERKVALAVVTIGTRQLS